LEEKNGVSEVKIDKNATMLSSKDILEATQQFGGSMRSSKRASITINGIGRQNSNGSLNTMEKD
jgi:hypothetical protein